MNCANHPHSGHILSGAARRNGRHRARAACRILPLKRGFPESADHLGGGDALQRRRCCWGIRSWIAWCFSIDAAPPVRGARLARIAGTALRFRNRFPRADQIRAGRRRWRAPIRIFGLDRSLAREPLASLFYSDPVVARSIHRVDRNLELAAAAGAPVAVHESPLPAGRAEGSLPQGPFVLACPLSGWRSKQWPLEYYARVAGRLSREAGVPLVLNGPPSESEALAGVPDAVLHLSSIEGLIHATRRATAVVGVDSGPLHIAAALGKPGVAIFGPTDPAQTGPYGGTFTVLRDPAAITSYKPARRDRRQTCAPSHPTRYSVRFSRNSHDAIIRRTVWLEMMFPKPYADFVARMRVPSGFLLVLAFSWFSRPDIQSLAYGLPVSLLGLAVRAWAAGHLAKNQTLAASGPYAFTRNPLYLGTLLTAAGLAIASRSLGLGALFTAVFLFIYLPVIQLEQQYLQSLFPDYAAYAARVPALLPRMTPAPGAQRAFQWSLYMKNQEYQAAAGFMAGTLFLLWKALR